MITDVHCRWSALRLGEQAGDGGSHTFAMPARGSYRFLVRVTTSAHSHPGGPIGPCGASARSYAPPGED